MVVTGGWSELAGFLVDPVVAVVDATDDRVVIWWIQLSRVGHTGSRLCGAWVLDIADVTKVRAVIARRVGFATTSGEQAVAKTGSYFDARLDLPGTIDAVTNARVSLIEAFEVAQRQRKPSSRLVEPNWPDLPPPLDVNSPPTVAGSPEVARALSIARYLDHLAKVWDALEDIRTSRKMLRDAYGNSTAGSELFPLQLVD